MLSEKERIERKIPVVFAKLMIPHLQVAEGVIYQGQSFYTWSSSMPFLYVKRCRRALDQLEDLVNRVRDRLHFGIEEEFIAIQKIPLCILPSGNPRTISEIVAHTKVS